MATAPLQIPFNEKGDQLSFPSNYAHKGSWKENFEFEDTLTYLDYSKGRSSITYYWQRSDGTKVTMFQTDFDDIIRKLVQGRISGKFTFSKRGTAYGCKWIGGSL